MLTFFFFLCLFKAMKEYSKSSLRKNLRAELLSQRRAAMRKTVGSGPRGKQMVQNRQKPDESSLGLINREFAIAKKLDHPNIVTLEEVLDNPEGDSLYLILEWCAKGPLKPAVADHPESAEFGKSSESSLNKVRTYDDMNSNSTNLHYHHHATVEHGDNNNSSSTDNNTDEEDDKPIVPTSTLSEEQCRLYFRDMILGIEYLHSQGVIHRDIKADNLLLDDDDVLKIADFGVSELFNEQEGENDIVTKTAGSPAYMAPELAIISNGTLIHLAATNDIPIHMLSGKSTDIWSMGVTLYYMLFGILPFRADNVMDLYAKIVTEDFRYPETEEPLDHDLCNLLGRMLCKSPQKRIKMDEIRQHPWVTLRGHDPLLTKEENTSDNITPVTEEDLISAIERVQGLGLGFEPEKVITRLKKLHGWRYETSSIRNGVIGNSSASNSIASSACNSRSPSLSPYLAPAVVAETSPPSSSTFSLANDNRLSVHRLTRALEEVVQRGSNPSKTVSHRRKISSLSNHSQQNGSSQGGGSNYNNVYNSYNNAANFGEAGFYVNPNVSMVSLDQNPHLSSPSFTNDSSSLSDSSSVEEKSLSSNKSSPAPRNNVVTDLIATLTHGSTSLHTTTLSDGYQHSFNPVNETDNHGEDIHATIGHQEMVCTPTLNAFNLTAPIQNPGQDMASGAESTPDTATATPMASFYGNNNNNNNIVVHNGPTNSLKIITPVSSSSQVCQFDDQTTAQPSPQNSQNPPQPLPSTSSSSSSQPTLIPSSLPSTSRPTPTSSSQQTGSSSSRISSSSQSSSSASLSSSPEKATTKLDRKPSKGSRARALLGLTARVR